MPRSSRAARTVAPLLALVVPLLGLPLASTAGAAGASSARVSVSGTFVEVPAEPGEGRTTPWYSVALADHTLVPVSLAGRRAPAPGSRVRGTVAVDAAARESLTRGGHTLTPGATVRSDSATGRAALRLLRVRGVAPRLQVTASTAPAAAATTPTNHRLYVAAPDLGAFTKTDPQLTAVADKVGDYWLDEANGRISSFAGADTVTHYTSTVSGAAGDCGLRSSAVFSGLVKEAQDKFPTATFTSGSDQLVIFVPAGSCTGGAEGIGYVGSSFASGGVVIAKDGSTAEGTLAHEMGHNFGFQHANLQTATTATEYGGLYEVMGYALSGVNQLTALSTASRVGAGVTDPGEVTTIDPRQDTAATTRSVTLAPRSDSTGVRGLALVDPDTGVTRYLDYRSGAGQDAGAQYTRSGYYFSFGNERVTFRPGVAVESAYASGRGVTYESTSPTVGLVAGDTWTNASGTLGVRVTTVTATGATLEVVFTPATPPPSQQADGPVPTVSGGPAWTDTRTAQVGTLDAGTAAAYQWSVGGTPVDGATSSTFAPDATAVGKAIAVAVTYTADQRTARTRTSTGVVATAATFDVTAPPTVSGDAAVDATLTATASGVGATRSTTTRALQWRSGGVDVAGATAPTYVVRRADVGRQITLVETLTADGYTTRTVSAMPTAIVPGGAYDAAPTPTVSGTAQVGQALSAAAGSWPGGTTLTYRWLAGGTVVSGATAATFMPAAAQLGQVLVVEVTGTAPGYDPTTRASGATAAVLAGTLSGATPTITGTAKVGRKLTLSRGTWTSGTTFAYQWFADGRAIARATATTYTLPSTLRGKRITVRVTGSKAGYTTLARTSARTAVVAKR